MLMLNTNNSTNLFKESTLFSITGHLKLLLYEPAAVLITTELHCVATQVLQCTVHERHRQQQHTAA
jgi:hypothetical protein